MKTRVVAYSGGIGSFLSAYLTVKKYGKENVELVFTDTKTEDEDLYRFLDETSKLLGLEIIKIEDGRNVWEVFMDVRYMGNSRIDPCSRLLKRDLFGKWLKSTGRTPESHTLVYGISWEEAHRYEKLKKRWDPYEVEAPLCTMKVSDVPDVEKLLSEANIAKPRLYGMGFPHNNCGGFCVKSGQKQFEMLYTNMPERYKWHEERQEKLFAKIGKHGFIRKRVNGELKYLSMKEFRQDVLEKGEDFDQLDLGGCGCFI